MQVLGCWFCIAGRARFELHFEKARGLFGDALDPIEARMTADEADGVKWDWQPARVGEFDRFVALLKQGMTLPQAAETMKISRAKSYRLRKLAAEMGVMS